MTGLKWTRRSTHTLSEALAAEDLAACPNTVATLLKENGYSLKRNRKEIGETQHPQRNAQFEHIAVIKSEFQDHGQPMISVDSKKRELVGLFSQRGPNLVPGSKTRVYPRLPDARPGRGAALRYL